MKILFYILVILVAYHLFLYPLILKIITLFYKNKTKQKNIFPSVSLIIAAHNEEEVIEQKIKNSLELNYPNLEIIIADDGSTDNTNKISQKYKNKIKIIKIKDRKGKINALNKTVPIAKGDFLVFSDANTFYEKNAIKHLIKHFNDKKVGCVTGYVKLIARGELKQGEGIYTKIEKSIQINESLINSVIGIDGAMYAIRKELFTPLKDFFIEDFITGMTIIKKGYRVIYEKKALAYEKSSPNINEEFKRRIRIVAGGFQSLKEMKFLIKHPIILIEFISHKLLRWILAEILILIFVINIFLLNNFNFIIIFYFQIVFYLSYLFINFSKYFITMQFASLLGLVRFITKTQSVKWDKAKRL